MRSVWISLLAVVSGVVPIDGNTESGGEIRILIQSSPLAGSQYYQLETLRSRIQPGDPLVLIRDPDNHHDQNAVRVLWQGEPLGYLPRKENRAVAQALDAGEPVKAVVEGITRDPDPWKRLRISVFVQL